MNQNMNENMNENKIEEVKENATEEVVNEVEKEKTASEMYEEKFSNGICSMLFKPINDITIRDLRIRDAFTRFLKEVECGNSITINDVLMSAVKCVASGEPDETAGNVIYSYDATHVKDKKIAVKLFKNSYSNVYSLFSVHNGISLDLSGFGGDLNGAESKNFLVASSRKASKLVANAKKVGVDLTKVGEVISSNKIILSSGSDHIATIEKSVLQSLSPIRLDIGTEQFDAFLSGYNSVCSLALCNCISKNNIIRFGLGGNIAEVFARALGFFAALDYLKILPARVVFVEGNNATVAVSRPNISDGDYLYLLKLKNDNYELPDKAHFGQLHYYLCEKKRKGIIKDVLPCGENINRVINRLCGQTLAYESLTEIPEDCFGVIVSVARGESVNGIKLGCFKDNL